MIFKVGDRVKIIEKGKDFGKVTTILKIHKGKAPYPIELDVNQGCYEYNYYHEILITHANIKNTKLARKMYPDHEIIDKDWICPRK